MSVCDSEKTRGWEDFYRATENRAPSPLLRRALGPDFLPTGNGHAIDLGSGAGLEALLLLNAGWNVHAIDKEPMAVQRVKALATSQSADRLTATVASFEEIEELSPSALIHAGLSLPFCASGSFARFWAQIIAALEPGGVFAGHLFGNRHDWALNPDMSFHTKDDVLRLCSGLEIELLRETEGDGGQVLHHWHRFDLILRK